MGAHPENSHRGGRTKEISVERKPYGQLIFPGDAAYGILGNFENLQEKKNEGAAVPSP